MIASPAQAAPIDLLTISDAANWEGGDLVFTVTYTGTVQQEFAFDVVDDTTTPASDYTDPTSPSFGASDTNITFPASSTTAPGTAKVTVHATTTGGTEGTERFKLRAVPGGTAGAPGAASLGNGVIWDLDATNHIVLSSSATTLPETAANGVQNSFTITATSTNPQQHDVTIPVKTADFLVDDTNSDNVADAPNFTTGSATPNGGDNRDYSKLAADAAIVIPANSTSGSVTVWLWDDTSDETDTQYFLVQQDTGPGRYTLGGDVTSGQDSLKLGIRDDDAQPKISVGDAKTVKEGSPLIYPVTLTNPSEKGVTYNLSVGGVDKSPAKAAMGDYVGNVTPDPDADFIFGGAGGTNIPPAHWDSTNLVFPKYAKTTNAMVTTTTLPVDGSMNPVFEGPENARATVSLPMGANATLDTQTYGDGTITDTGNGQDLQWSDTDDPWNNTWDQSWDEGDSGPVAKKIYVRFKAGTTLPTTLNYKFVDVEAKNGSDYIGKDGSVTVPANTAPTNYVAIPVTIIGDRVWEPSETFNLVLTDPNGVAELPVNGEVTFTINNDDAKPVWTTGDVMVQEGNSGQMMAKIPLKLNTPAGVDAKFTATVTNGSAEENASTPGGDDYDLPKTMTTTIKAGATAGWFEVPVNGDKIFEKDEFFTVDFTNGAPTDIVRATIDSQLSSKVTIGNDDAQPTATFATASGTEGGKVTVTPTIVGESQYAYELGFSVAPGGEFPATLDKDYTVPDDLADYVLPVAAGYTGPLGRMAVPLSLPSFALLDDDIDEPTETFQVTVSEVTTVLKGFTSASTLVRINDDPNDLPPAAWVDDLTVGENDHVAKLPVDLKFNSNATSTTQTVTIPWYTQDGTAKAGQDYKSSKGTLYIKPGTMRAWIEVPIMDDHTKEPNETFTVRLGTPGPLGASLLYSDSTITIKSDDTVDTSVTLMVAPTVVGGINTPIWGKTAPGATVELWGAPISAKPAPLAKLAWVKAGADGTYKFTRTLSQGYRFKVASEGVISAEKRVMVTQAPVFVVGSPSKGMLSLAVQGTPRGVGQAVVVEKWVGGKWVTAWKGTTGSNNQWRAMVKAPSKSAWSLRAFVQGYPANGINGGYSGTKKVTIK
ncbi:Calx-beta domain-containing protein [Paractinoplanes ferrugineus]|nr:Calx-beta domain-containing protein [Actinoplanes ferrugineus]